jgi:hypothetical protein
VSFWWGAGNIDVDPLFARAGYWDDAGTPENTWDDFWVDGDYHLRSSAGRWDGLLGEWVFDDVTSRCIDAGSPGFGLGDEFGEASNVRINMGAYGGTAEASRTPAGWGILSDMSNDGFVGLEDFGMFGSEWGLIGEGGFEAAHLRAGADGPPWGGDLNRDGVVGLGDVLLLAEEWMAGVE